MAFRRGGAKYNAVPTVVYGFRFASKAEAGRYLELLRLGTLGLVRNLELQPRFDLHVGGVRVGTYVADFRYEARERAIYVTGHTGGAVDISEADYWNDVVEDVKGVRTPVYKLKKRHAEAEHGIFVLETRPR